MDETATLTPERLLRQLEWRVVRRLDGQLQGDYRSLFRGSGLDFTNLREYEPGDDLRHIEWNVTARMDTPYVREYIEDREVTAWLLLDHSASMGFGPVDRQKDLVLAEVATTLALVLTRRRQPGGHGRLRPGRRAHPARPRRAGTRSSRSPTCSSTGGTPARRRRTRRTAPRARRRRGRPAERTRAARHRPGRDAAPVRRDGPPPLPRRRRLRLHQRARVGAGPQPAGPAPRGGRPAGQRPARGRAARRRVDLRRGRRDRGADLRRHLRPGLPVAAQGRRRPSARRPSRRRRVPPASTCTRSAPTRTWCGPSCASPPCAGAGADEPRLAVGAVRPARAPPGRRRVPPAAAAAGRAPGRPRATGARRPDAARATGGGTSRRSCSSPPSP